ncbi:hypothetical protein LRM40_02555 [Ideonella dechloratans]|nr:hypothetical protein LRM40_02555 [Ideonella dechloratans]
MKVALRRWRGWGVCLLLGLLGLLKVDMALAQSSLSTFEEQGELKRGSRSITVLGPDLAGDKIDLYTGAVTLTRTDIDIPGNNTLPVSWGMRFALGPRLHHWDPEIPRIWGTYASGKTVVSPTGWVGIDGSSTARCSKFSGPPVVMQRQTQGSVDPDEYWSGHHLYVPGQVDELLLGRGTQNTFQPTTGSYPVVTKSHWQLSCITLAPGSESEGFIALSPSGTQYRFDHLVSRGYDAIQGLEGTTPRQEIWILPSKVTDRFGNTVTYTYDGTDPWKVTNILASDGRELRFIYQTDGSYTVTAYSTTTALQRTWSYSADGMTVTLPDQTQWQYNLQAAANGKPYFYPAAGCGSNDVWTNGTLSPGPKTSTVTTPSGATVSFTMDWVAHGTSGLASSASYNPCPLRNATLPSPTPIYGAWSLKTKTITGPGMGSGASWNYSWSVPEGTWYCGAGCTGTKTVTVTDPEGNATRYTFNNIFEKDGELVKLEEGVSGSTALRTTVNTYYSPNVATGDSGQWNGHFLGWTIRALQKRVITQQDKVFTFEASTADFDAVGRPTKVTRSSTLTATPNTVTETTAYQDLKGPWVINLVSSLTESTTGLKPKETTYTTLGLPYQEYAFGKLKATYTYNTDGTLKTVKDGRDNVTTFSNYKRGLPQKITYADNKYQQAVVNDLGLITSLTNEALTTTSYDYDAAGRLKSITYPTGDAVTYNNTTLVFEPVTTAEYGLPAGHWRQTVTTGNGVTKNYFDALWRKRVTLSQDTAVASTLRAALTQYDSDGRVTFQGYPQATVPSITDTPKGTTTVYDPLGRETSRTIDTELSPAQRTATNVYQSGFTTQTKDFNGNVSTSSFQAYDNPDKAVLAGLSGPEGLNLKIYRDAFGATTSMVKSGTSGGATTSVTRSYVYDSYHQLCKTVEPELGATVQDWDAAGNLAWRSGGVSLTSTGSCDTASVAAARKISYGYDARNRLTSTTFGDGSPAITRTYTDDGLIATLYTDPTTAGGTNYNNWTYEYNNRRLLTKETLNIGTSAFPLTWGYDANGNVSALTYPDGALVNFSPNALGEPTAANARVSGATYWPNGAVKSYTLGNGITHTVSQNVRGLPSQITDGSVLSDQYSYDANGNVLGITDLIDGSSTRTMQYDGLNRLKTANGIWGSGSYTYDVQDNIRSSTVGSRVLTHSYDAATNRLTTVAGTGASLAYDYDANGNISSRSSNGTPQALVFDLGNRLKQTTGVASYTYDGNGRRVSAWNNADSTTQQYVYDHTGVLRFQRNWASGTKKDTKYLYLGNRLVTEVNSAGTYTHEDALGSPVARTNDSAALISKTRYEPYGNVASGFVPTKPDNIGFTGHVFDSNTGLVQMQQRYYDPIAGRFLSVDPLMSDANTGKSFGRYNYANNSPYKFVDPDGKDSIIVQVGGSAVFGVGVEGSLGVYVTGFPEPDIGVFASGGYGYGISVGLSEQIGLVPGPTSNISGDTKNTNVSTAFLSGTVMRDPKTGKVVGGTAGPAAKLGASQTNSTTGTAGLRGLLGKIFEIIFKPTNGDNNKKPEEPKKPKSENGN